MFIHIDLDAYFASAERTQNPNLLNRPIIVGGRGDQHIFEHDIHAHHANVITTQAQGNFSPTILRHTHASHEHNLDYFTDSDGRIRGIAMTASYEARAYGIRTGMSINEALWRCPNLSVLVPHYTLYQDLSSQMRHLLQQHIPLLEQYSIDEFFGDLSGWVGDDELFSFMQKVQEGIKTKLNLPASIGIGHTKTMAKLATSFAKPFGIYYLSPTTYAHVIHTLPIKEFPGIGRRIARQLHAMQFHTVGEVKQYASILTRFGTYGKSLLAKINGEDSDPVMDHKERKSIGMSRAFDPLYSREELRRRIIILIRHIAHSVIKLGRFPTTYQLSLRYEFNVKAAQSHTQNRLFNEPLLRHTILTILHHIDQHKNLHVIRLSISVSNFIDTKHTTFSLLHLEEDQRHFTLLKASALLRERYGVDILRWGSEALTL
jgi:DNA polymerase-4